MNFAEAVLAFMSAALDAYNKQKSGGLSQADALTFISTSHAQLQAQFAAEDAELAKKFPSP